MDPNTKQWWLDLAELIDTFRVVPRIVLFSTLGFAGVSMAAMLNWYFSLPAAERTLEATGFMTVVIPALAGIVRLVINDYTKGGRDWDVKDSGGVDNSVNVDITKK
jgi:hypothetical protein